MLSLERYGFIILIVVIYVGGLDIVYNAINPLCQWLLGGDWLLAMFG
jgi:hypothetical protein